MRGNRTSGSLNWMDGGATTTIDCLWAPFSIATPKLPANSVQKNIESSPTCFSHTTKPTMTRCTTYSTDIHLIYAIFRELHGIQRQVAIIIIIPQKSASHWAIQMNHPPKDKFDCEFQSPEKLLFYAHRDRRTRHLLVNRLINQHGETGTRTSLAQG